MIDEKVERLEQEVKVLTADIRRIEVELSRAIAKMEVYEILQEAVDANRSCKDNEGMEENK